MSNSQVAKEEVFLCKSSVHHTRSSLYLNIKLHISTPPQRSSPVGGRVFLLLRM